MPKFYSELQEASFEHLSSDPGASVSGRVYVNTTEARIKTDDGTDKRALLRNDLKCVVGNSGTASENIRLHRGAAGVIQLLTGDDATAEGSLSANVNQLSARQENYTDAGKPAAGNAGRVAYITDLQTWLGDNGSDWVPVGGAGGGGSITWVEAAQAPLKESSSVSGVESFEFEDAITQYLYTSIKVPTSYISGRPINLKSLFFTPTTSGNVLLQTVATLIRPGTDAMTSTTNQHTSTNSALTVAGTANIPTLATMDLTDSSGAINSVSVSAGDLILIRVERVTGTDTLADTAKVLAESSEVTYD